MAMPSRLIAVNRGIEAAVYAVRRQTWSGLQVVTPYKGIAGQGKEKAKQLPTAD
jgi:hypothetical protein